jgi:hypothetical protein
MAKQVPVRYWKVHSCTAANLGLFGTGGCSQPEKGDSHVSANIGFPGL